MADLTPTAKSAGSAGDIVKDIVIHFIDKLAPNSCLLAIWGIAALFLVSIVVIIRSYNKLELKRTEQAVRVEKGK